MSFSGWKKYIEEGDLVIVYMVKESELKYLKKLTHNKSQKRTWCLLP